MRIGNTSITSHTNYINIINTPIGNMQASATAQGICYLGFTDHNNNTPSLLDYIKKWQITVIPKNNAYLIQLQEELQAYFLGKKRTFTVAIDIYGTLFQKKVWAALAEIPYAKTWNYMQQSHTIGNSNAVRAVANANRLNPLSILLPCHRVIAKNGKLIGYHGGLWRKKWLIELEKNSITKF